MPPGRHARLILIQALTYLRKILNRDEGGGSYFGQDFRGTDKFGASDLRGTQVGSNQPDIEDLLR